MAPQFAASSIREKSSIPTLLRDVFVIALIALIVSVGLKNFLVRSFYIPSPSMERTLLVNDRIMVNELVPHPFALSHGDVVVFEDPAGWLPPRAVIGKSWLMTAVDWVGVETGLAPDDSLQYLVKRVIGLPGDRVACCNALGQLTVNDAPISEPYIQLPAGQRKVSAMSFSVVVPREAFWVMGDNRYDSADSRFHQDDPNRGFVPQSKVVGVAFAITWPFSRFGMLDSYSDEFATEGGSTSRNKSKRVSINWRRI